MHGEPACDLKHVRSSFPRSKAVAARITMSHVVNDTVVLLRVNRTLVHREPLLPPQPPSSRYGTQSTHQLVTALLPASTAIVDNAPAMAKPAAVSKPAIARYRSLAISPRWGRNTNAINDDLPPLYGHIWPHMYAFWVELVRPQLARIDEFAETPWRTLYLPAGAHVGQRGGEHAFEEFEALWGAASNATRLRIERVPWVPICVSAMVRARDGTSVFPFCCFRSETEVEAQPGSSGLDGGTAATTAVLTDFPSPGAEKRYSRYWQTRSHDWDAFRRDAWRSLFGAASAVPPPSLVVWVLASAGSNGRRVHGEAGLASLAKELTHELRPSLDFRVLRPGRGVERYVKELRTFSQAAVVVSLFGSSLHNCHFVPSGSVVVELHGALKNDVGPYNDYFYRRACEPVGVHWIGYATRGFRERGPNATNRVPSAYATAHVSVPHFRAFFARVLRGGHDPAERAALLGEYAAAMHAAPAV